MFTAQLLFFSSDSELKKGQSSSVRSFVRPFVRSFGSSLSRAVNLHHFGSNFQVDFKGLS